MEPPNVELLVEEWAPEWIPKNDDQVYVHKGTYQGNHGIVRQVGKNVKVEMPSIPKTTWLPKGSLMPRGQ